MDFGQSPHGTHKPGDMKETQSLKCKPLQVVGANTQQTKKRQPTGDNMSVISTVSEWLSTSTYQSSNPPSIIDIDSDGDTGVHDDGIGDNGVTDLVPEDAEAELGDSYQTAAKMQAHIFLVRTIEKEWNAPIYAFYEAVPNIDYNNGW